MGVAASLLLAGCGGENDPAAPERLRYRETAELSMVDEDDRWTLVAGPHGGDICVGLRAGLGGGRICSDGEQGPVGMLGMHNGTFAPIGTDDAEGGLPPELVAAGADHAFVYGRVFADVAQVRLTTNRGDVFEVEALRPDDPGPRYFVVLIPAEDAPLDMQIDLVEFGVVDRSSPDAPPRWVEDTRYSARHSR